jgi:DNA-directed RNA polymerase specialized sigma24 family protein
VLRYFMGFSTAEIAETLDIDQGTVKTCLYRARHALAAVLGEDDDHKEANYA